MQELNANAKKLKDEVHQSIGVIGLDKLENKQRDLSHEAQRPDFWDDSDSAQRTMQEIASLDARIKDWVKLRDQLNDLIELSSTDDSSLKTELETQLNVLAKRHEGLKKELMFLGPYDQKSAILTIYAGAGGTDAQDWAVMLERMYLRFCELHNFKTTIIDRSAGEEAGIKSVTFEVKGRMAYGKLKGEHGVHRLVRLSPFNSDNLRQTSFAKVDILPEIDTPTDIEIDEKDLKVDVFRAGGHGGQSVNTTDSAVRITHIPTKIVVSIQNERSQLQNKETAMTILRSRLAQLKLEQHQDKIQSLKGPNKSAEWGNQIRSYVLHPYKQIKDLRTKYETSNVGDVLDGKIDAFIDAYLEKNIKLQDGDK